MSILSSPLTGAFAPTQRMGWARRLAAWPLALMAHWHRRATIKALQELDDRTLRDIGLTRADLQEALRDTSSLDLWLQI
jgi:uncharacterized protein YjiS (DUF1127 family)